LAINATVSFTFAPNTTISSSQVNTNKSDEVNIWTGLEALTKTFAKLKMDADPGTALEVATRQFAISPPGTTTNDNAATGIKGEYVSASVLVSSPTNAPATTNEGDLMSISLTAGDWDISLNMGCKLNAATITEWSAGISTTTGNSVVGLIAGDNFGEGPIPVAATDAFVVIPAWRVSISSTTIYYAKMEVTYSAGTPRLYGRISARRVR
jgi:hypothetical protein